MAIDWGALIGGAASSYGGGMSGGGGGSGWEKAMPYVMAGLSVASALSKGKEKGRQEEGAASTNTALFKQKEASDAERALLERALLELQQRQFGQDSQNNAYKNAIRSSLMKNYQPITVNRPDGVPTIKFNLGEGFGDEGRAAGGAMYEKAMDALMKGESFDKLPPIERTGAPVYKGPGKMENILGAIGTAGSAINSAQTSSKNQALIDALMKGQSGQQQPLPNTTIPGAQPGFGAPIGPTGSNKSIADILAELAEKRNTPTEDDSNLWG